MLLRFKSKPIFRAPRSEAAENHQVRILLKSNSASSFSSPAFSISAKFKPTWASQSFFSSRNFHFDFDYRKRKSLASPKEIFSNARITGLNRKQVLLSFSSSSSSNFSSKIREESEPESSTNLQAQIEFLEKLTTDFSLQEKNLLYRRAIRPEAEEDEGEGRDARNRTAQADDFGFFCSELYDFLKRHENWGLLLILVPNFLIFLLWIYSKLTLMRQNPREKKQKIEKGDGFIAASIFSERRALLPTPTLPSLAPSASTSLPQSLSLSLALPSKPLCRYSLRSLHGLLERRHQGSPHLAAIHFLHLSRYRGPLYLEHDRSLLFCAGPDRVYRCP